MIGVVVVLVDGPAEKWEIVEVTEREVVMTWE